MCCSWPQTFSYEGCPLGIREGDALPGIHEGMSSRAFVRGVLVALLWEKLSTSPPSFFIYIQGLDISILAECEQVTGVHFASLLRKGGPRLTLVWLRFPCALRSPNSSILHQILGATFRGSARGCWIVFFWNPVCVGSARQLLDSYRSITRQT